MPTDRERAEAAEILAQPTEPQPQPFLPVAAMFSPDGKPGGRLNPDYVDWSTKLHRKLIAVAILLGVDTKQNVSEMNWHAVALGLAMRYHPGFRPKKKPGRSRTKHSDSRYVARKELLKLVSLHMDRIKFGRKSVGAVLSALKKDEALPLVFKRMRPNTIRQEISIAKKELRSHQKFMADLLRDPPKPIDYSQLLFVPGRDFSETSNLSGLGLLAKPMRNPD